jgi:hypothetical protein
MGLSGDAQMFSGVKPESYVYCLKLKQVKHQVLCPEFKKSTGHRHRVRILSCIYGR